MNEEVFLSALHENPTDELTWLALADWLEETGQEPRAELMRCVRRLRRLPVMKRTKAKSAREDRVAELLREGVRPVVAEISNSIGMRMALIEPGTFRMGSPSSEKERSSDEESHEVTLTRPFYLGVFAVTQSQYEAVMGTNPSWFSASGGGKENVVGMDTGDLPVERLSWDEAVEFCRRLTEREVKARPGWAYRLPSEAEWEYACRGVACSSATFHFGTFLDSTQANFNGMYPYGGAAKGPYLWRTCAVGSYRPNVFGLYDMHGNVWEWCADWFGEYDAGPVTDHSGPEHGSDRVIRGGSWLNFGQNCRAAHRDRNAPSNRNNYLGFRAAVAAQ